ncbi:PREDICTED: uncharacterized protein LOC109466758 [Branchiostoma belcheri]|uniref:Uncharacterized protein LOC109466758 n=1 Tax=Branchiostoma belcheri TaxID=7741 RepID=A0A6P4XU07_BRABE|nr:PREDICTED: uncharacterized protein LOC109466758 [Branchiostoma belcheri]
MAMTRGRIRSSSLQDSVLYLFGPHQKEREITLEEKPYFSKLRMCREILLAGRGLLFGIMSGLGYLGCATIGHILVKQKGFSGFQTIALSMLFSAAAFVPWVVVCKPPLTEGDWKLYLSLVVMAVAQAVSGIGMLLAAYLLQLANMYAIISGAVPVFIAIISYLFLREPPSVADVLGILINIAGISFIAAGELHNKVIIDVSKNVTSHGNVLVSPDEWWNVDPSLNRALGVVCAILSAFASTVAYSLSRTSRVKESHLMTILVYMSIAGIVLSLPWMYVLGKPKWEMSSSEGSLFIGMGVSYSVALFCVHYSLRLEKATTVTILRNVNIVFSFIIQYDILNIVPTVFEIIGSVLIIVSITLVTAYSWYINWKKRVARKLREYLNLDESSDLEDEPR